MKNEFIRQYKTALVTGAAGFIGSHIVEELLDYGIKVIAIDDFSAGHIRNLEIFLPNENLIISNCDVSDFDLLRENFYNVDIVFHNAASKKNICLIDPARDLMVNAKGTLNIMQLAKEFNVKKVVHASTGSVYGEPISMPIDENSPLNPVSYYGVSKLAGDRYVDVFGRLHNIDTTTLRYFHVYGPRQETDGSLGGVVAIFANNLINNERIVIHGDGDQIRSFTYVKDIVAANILSAISTNSRNQVYNCASGIQVSINLLAQMMMERLNTSDNSMVTFGDELIGDIRYFDIDNSKILSLGIKFTDFNIGLDSTIKYFQKLNGSK